MSKVDITMYNFRNFKNNAQSFDSLYASFFIDNHSIMLLINPDSGDIIDANEAAQIEQVPATIQQIASGTQHIVVSVRQVDAISEEVAAQAQTVSAGVEEQTIHQNVVDQLLKLFSQIVYAAWLFECIRKYKFSGYPYTCEIALIEA